MYLWGSCAAGGGRKISGEAAVGGLESVCLAHVFPTRDITAVFTRLTGSLLNDWSKERGGEVVLSHPGSVS